MSEDNGTCPMCGQPYDYKREERGTLAGGKYRSDAVICKTEKIGSKRTAYIHIRGSKSSEDRVEVSRSTLSMLLGNSYILINKGQITREGPFGKALDEAEKALDGEITTRGLDDGD